MPLISVHRDKINAMTAQPCILFGNNTMNTTAIKSNLTTQGYKMHTQVHSMPVNNPSDIPQGITNNQHTTIATMTERVISQTQEMNTIAPSYFGHLMFTQTPLLYTINHTPLQSFLRVFPF